MLTMDKTVDFFSIFFYTDNIVHDAMKSGKISEKVYYKRLKDLIFIIGRSDPESLNRDKVLAYIKILQLLIEDN